MTVYMSNEQLEALEAAIAEAEATDQGYLSRPDKLAQLKRIAAEQRFLRTEEGWRAHARGEVVKHVNQAITMIIVLCFSAGLVWAIIAFWPVAWNAVIWPGLAKIHDYFAGPVGVAETEQRLTAMDDCLAKAGAKQPPSRPLKPLVADLRDACAYEIEYARLGLIAGGKSEEIAVNTIYFSHIQPAALRAKPQ